MPCLTIFDRCLLVTLSDDMQTLSEHTVYHVVKKWSFEAYGSERKSADIIQRLLGSVRFPLMSANFLSDIVSEDPKWRDEWTCACSESSSTGTASVLSCSCRGNITRTLGILANEALAYCASSQKRKAEVERYRKLPQYRKRTPVPSSPEGEWLAAQVTSRQLQQQIKELQAKLPPKETAKESKEESKETVATAVPAATAASVSSATTAPPTTGAAALTAAAAAAAGSAGSTTAPTATPSASVSSTATQPPAIPAKKQPSEEEKLIEELESKIPALSKQSQPHPQVLSIDMDIDVQEALKYMTSYQPTAAPAASSTASAAQLKALSFDWENAYRCWSEWRYLQGYLFQAQAQIVWSRNDKQFFGGLYLFTAAPMTSSTIKPDSFVPVRTRLFVWDGATNRFTSRRSINFCLKLNGYGQGDHLVDNMLRVLRSTDSDRPVLDGKVKLRAEIELDREL